MRWWAGAPACAALALACASAPVAMAAGEAAFPPGLRIDSTEKPDRVAGEVTAVVDHPFAVAQAALRDPSHWCDILILHLNIKYCRAVSEGTATTVRVRIGQKHDQPLDSAYAVDFDYRVGADTPRLLQVRLGALEGPLGTRDYRIVLDVEPAPDGRTSIRLSYSYAYGLVARLAMEAYLATVGRDKVGFTTTGTGTDGRPLYIRGMRGVTERNTMRYYLAVEAFLGSLATPREARIEKSLRDWFAAIERYPRQLHEMDEGEYLAMKRTEYARQKAGAP